MGQKSNLLSLRKNKNFNLINLQPKNVLYSNIFLQNLKKLFFQKKIFLVNCSLNLIGNQAVLNLYLFYRTVKINSFKGKLIAAKKKEKKTNVFSALYERVLKQFKSNLIILSVTNLNKQYEKTVFLKLFSKFKQFHNTLFPRRFNFFIDFLKVTSLFLTSKINLTFYTETIGQIFKILPKRRHNFFFSFMEQFFRVLINDIKLVKNENIKGVKFMLSGRIQAKPRAKFKYFQVGNIPMQSISENVEFSKLHIFTVYGVFGLKIWTYKK
jgi:hypothetical protein